MESKRFWVISNMYPSKENPRFGIFVYHFIRQLENLGLKIPFKSLIYGRKHRTVLNKLIDYLKFYPHIIWTQWFKSKHFDSIYIHFPLQTAFILRSTKKNIYLNFHGSEIASTSFLNKILFKSLIRLVEKQNVTIIAPSQIYKEKLNTIFKLNDEKYYVFPSGGVNRAVFKPFDPNQVGDLKRKFNLHESNFILGYVSSLLTDKDPFTVLTAFHKIIKENLHPNITLLLVGSGPLQENILKFISDNKLEKHTKVLPSTDQKTLAEIYNVLDIFMFPSIRESLGLVGLEAMSCGKIVVSAKNGGSENYIMDGVNGFLFDPKQSTDLINQITKIIGFTLQERKNIERNAIITTSEYESTKVFKDLYAKLSDY